MTPRAGALCLDLGSDCGWARERPGLPPRLGTWNLRAPSKHPGAMLCNLTDFLWDHCSDDPPEKIVYEAPFMMIPKQGDKAMGNAATLEHLLCLTAPVKMMGCRLSIPVYLIAVSSARKGFCGNGRATKEEVYEEAVRRGWNPANMHESDAGALSDQYQQLFHPEEWARCNPGLAAARAYRRR